MAATANSARDDWYRKLRANWRSGRTARRPFYRQCGLIARRHPAYLSASARTIDSRVFVSHDHRYLFVRVPKCANTTILSTLGLLERGHDAADLAAMDEGERQKVLRKRNMKLEFVRPSELDGATAKKVLAEYRKCIFVRNPFTRLASAYLHKVRSGDYADHRGLSADMSFASFCDYLADGGLHDNIHWFPQTSICPLSPAELDFVGRFENLADDLQALTRLIYGVSADAVTTKHRPTHAADHVRALYTEREMRLVAELYADDFSGFDYPADRLS